MTRDDIRKLADAATPGPWHASWRGIGWEVHTDGTPGRCWEPQEPDHHHTHDGQKDTMESGEDAAFIAAARTAVPLLLDVADAAAALLSAIDTPGGDEYGCELALVAALDRLEAA